MSVDDYPAASKPTPQIYLQADPKPFLRTTAASLKVRSSPDRYQFANVHMTAKLIKNEISKDIPVSILK